MSELKLKPCPFCGGEAKVEKLGGYAVVSCLKDDCNGNSDYLKYDSVKEAVEAWNTRKPMERIIERLRNQYPVNPYPNEFSNGRDMANSKAIQIVEEEGGVK